MASIISARRGSYITPLICATDCFQVILIGVHLLHRSVDEPAGIHVRMLHHGCMHYICIANVCIYICIG